jgi:hypothetical protein
MAALSIPDRVAAQSAAMAGGGWTAPITKADLLLAVNAIDDWVEANSAAFNTAIPQPARTQLTTKQKARLLMLVVSRRFEVTP